MSIIFTAIYDFIKSKPIFSTFCDLLKWIWNNVFEVQLQIWQILLIIITFWIVKSIIIAMKKNSENLSNQNSNDWEHYTKDNIDGLNLRWKFIKNVKSNEWNVQNITIV